MPDLVATLLLGVLTVYAAVGVIVGSIFAWRGAQVIDASGSPMSRGFRLIITPAAAALWPWILVTWTTARRKGTAA